MIIDASNKKILLIDKNINTDHCTTRKTVVKFLDPETGECIFEKSNKIILPGSIFTAAKHWNITPTVRTPSYNTEMLLDGSVNENPGISGIRREEMVSLFSMGIGGCGISGNQVYDVNYKKWATPAELIPFRFVDMDSDISSTERSIYFGRKSIETKVAYYFKKFDTTPDLKIRYTDGTLVTEGIYNSAKTDEVSVYVETKLRVLASEAVEYFAYTSGLNDAKINTISLLTAWPTIQGGFTYYQDIRPLSKINIPNEYLSRFEKGMDIIYQVYY